jgi:hypothetical protein
LVTETAKTKMVENEAGDLDDSLVDPLPALKQPIDRDLVQEQKKA